jgi:hypothetical protein
MALIEPIENNKQHRRVSSILINPSPEACLVFKSQE